MSYKKRGGKQNKGEPLIMEIGSNQIVTQPVLKPH